jgi:superfamily I DNA/RNA helicase
MHLNPDQRAAVEHRGHCAIVACPGSGKTRVLVEKAAHILTTEPAATILIVTFTRDAAREVRTRLEQRVPQAIPRVEAHTFHAVAIRHCLSSALFRQLLVPAQQAALLRRAWNHAAPTIPWETFRRTVDARASGLATPPLDPSFETAFDYYLELLETHAALDFGNVIVRSAQAIRAGTLPPIPCSYIMVDEAQDVSHAQMDWAFAHAERGAVTVVVGDDDQAIYGWRGALGHAALHQMVHRLEARLITLQINYRSHSEIIGLASRLIRNNSGRVAKELEADRGPGGSVTLLPCADSQQEVEEIVERVRRRPGDWAILARSNFKLDHVEQGLIRAQVPYVRPGAKDFWESEGPALLLSLLAMRQEPDPLTLGAALAHAGVAEPDIRRIVTPSGLAVPRLRAGLDAIARHRVGSLERCLAGLLGAPPEMAIRATSDWLVAHSSVGNSSTGAIMAATDVLLALSGSLVERVRYVRRPQRKQSTGAVTLTTFHNSKGCEYPRVVACGLIEGVVPSRKAESVEEERRLLYVAMTRAQSELVLSFPWRLVQQGAKVRRLVRATPSRFLTMDLGIPLSDPYPDPSTVHQ